MNLISQLFFAVLISGITGSIMMILWMIAKVLPVKLGPESIYGTLRLVCLMYLLPLGYILVLLFYKGRIVCEGGFIGLGNFMVTGGMKDLITGVALLWGVAILAVLLNRLLRTVRWNRLCSRNVLEDDVEIIGEFERIKKQVGIKGKVALYRNDLIDIPMIAGIWRRKIILPGRTYTKEELKVIFYHELAHGKSADVLFKFLSVLVTILHCFNPAAYCLKTYIGEWSEFCCDWKVRKYAGDEFTVKEYYSRIMTLLDECEDRKTEQYDFAALFENGSILKRRLEFMCKYQRQAPIARGGVIIAMLFTVLLGSFTAYSSGRAVVGLHDCWYSSTENLIQEKGRL